jgi:hypothetical protein
MAGQALKVRALLGERPRALLLPAVGLLVVLTSYSLLAGYYRHTGMMAPDESFYTVAARAVYEGRVPYLDFAYTQTPLLPYLNGLILKVVGLGMDSHRLVNAVWGGLGLVLLMAALWRRLGRAEPAIVTGFLLAASPRWVSLQALGVWCGPAGALLNLAAAAVLWPGPLWRRVALFAVAGTLSIGCRMSCAPMVVVLAVPLLLEAGGLRRALILLGVCLGVGAICFLPFAIAAPANFLFHVWQFHVESGIERNFQAQAMQWWNVAPAAILVLAAGLFGLPALLRKRRFTEIALLGAGLVGVTTPMIPESAWGVYIAAGVPLAAAGGICTLWTAGAMEGNPYRHAIWVLPLISFFLILPFEVTEGAATEPEEVGAFIRNEVEPGPVLSPAGIVAVEAGRDVIPGTEMGTFSAMHPDDAQRAARAHMTTLPELTRLVLDQEPAAIVKMIDPGPWIVWNFRWTLPSFDTQPLDAIYAFEDAISECYEPVWTTMTMEVHVRREPPPPEPPKPTLDPWRSTEAATSDGMVLVRGLTLNRRHNHGGPPVRVGLARFEVENRDSKTRRLTAQAIDFLQSHGPVERLDVRGLRVRDQGDAPHPNEIGIPAGEQRTVEVLFDMVPAYQGFDDRFLFRVTFAVDGDPVVAAAKLRVARVTPLFRQ